MVVEEDEVVAEAVPLPEVDRAVDSAVVDVVVAVVALEVNIFFFFLYSSFSNFFLHFFFFLFIFFSLSQCFSSSGRNIPSPVFARDGMGLGEEKRIAIAVLYISYPPFPSNHRVPHLLSPKTSPHHLFHPFRFHEPPMLTPPQVEPVEPPVAEPVAEPVEAVAAPAGVEGVAADAAAQPAEPVAAPK